MTKAAESMSKTKNRSETRIGVIGAGWWAVKNHIPVLQSRPDVRIVSICGLGRRQLTELQEKFSIPFATENYHELLQDESLDGVIVCSPHACHFEHAHAALERGLHVLCEKPMVLRASEAHRLAALVESKSLTFLVPYGWNYTPLAIAARDLMDTGMLGTIEYVNCIMASATRDLFSGQAPWFSKEDLVKPDPLTWSAPSTGGGFAHGQLTHALGLLFYVTQLEPEEVFAEMTWSPTGADLTNAISCRFKNGATGILGGAGTMPPLSTYQVDIRIFGTGGMLLLDIERPRLELRCHDGRNISVPLDFKPGEYSCVEPLYVFIDLIEGKQAQNRSSTNVAVPVVEVLDAAFQSAKSGARQLVAKLS